jgi:hypothetical protein
MAAKKENQKGVFTRIKAFFSWPFSQLAKLFRTLFPKKASVNPSPDAASDNIPAVIQPIVDSTPSRVEPTIEPDAQPAALPNEPVKTPAVAPSASVTTSPVSKPSTTAGSDSDFLKQPAATVRMRSPNAIVLPSRFSDRPENVQNLLEDLALRNFLLPDTLEALKTGAIQNKEGKEILSETAAIAIAQKDRAELEAIQQLFKEIALLPSSQQKELEGAFASALKEVKEVTVPEQYKKISGFEDGVNSLEVMGPNRRACIAGCTKKLAEAFIPFKRLQQEFYNLEALRNKAWELLLAPSLEQTAKIEQELDKNLAALTEALYDFYKMTSEQRIERIEPPSQQISALIQEIKKIREPIVLEARINKMTAMLSKIAPERVEMLKKEEESSSKAKTLVKLRDELSLEYQQKIKDVIVKIKTLAPGYKKVAAFDATKTFSLERRKEQLEELEKYLEQISPSRPKAK